MSDTFVSKASDFAKIAHEGQLRKNSKEPYFNHCKRVAETLSKYGFSDSIVAAAYLHDTVEDTSVTFQDITDAFGEEVASFVRSNTENKKKSWEERKAHTIEYLKVAPLENKALIIADKLDNLRSFQEQFEIEGENIWQYFFKGRDDQKKYYEGLRDAMWQNISPSVCPPFFKDFDELVLTFFQ